MTLPLPSFTRFLVRVIPLLVLLVGASLLTQAQTIRYVKPIGTGAGNGSSWANASGNLQAMINASVATDQVWVAGGTYKPTTGTDRNASFAMKIGVLIYGGFAGSETSLSQRPIINTTTPSSTTLSGNIGNAGSTADNSYHVISNPMDLINTAVLDGFIITGGNANGGSSAGGGMYNPGNDSGLGASPTVRNCSFQGNSAGIGGAIHNYGSATSNPVLVNCLFRDNSATISGGAIYNYKNSGAVGNPVLTNCSFQNNSAATSGGAIFNLGYFSNCAPVLTNCSFQNNSAPQGGAFYNDGTQFYSRPKLNNCVLFGNGGSNSIRNSQDSYVEAAYSLFEAGAAFTNGFLGSNVSGVTANPFASTSSVALNACAPAINSGNNDAYNQYNGTPTDLAGNARFYAEGQIDMGAVEFQAAPQSITITPPSASSATTGTAFSQFFSASGGSGPYMLASGSLPPGITLATSGVLSGTPTQFGSYTFIVKIVDPVTGCSGISAPYTLLVRSDRPIRYVKVGGTGNGDSWANASGDLQSQINVAGAEQVWVAAGTYKPTTGTDRIISFAMRTGVAIYGGFVGNETALSNRPTINPVRGNPSTTILSGDIGVVGNNSDNSYHVILNRDGLTSTAILDGFVITGGNANRDGYSYEGGGGMANICQHPAGAISPTVRNCSFQGNTATLGGAIFNDASAGNTNPQQCNPTLINCVFQDNSARAGGAVSNNASGGSFCSPQFDNCYFINNTANNGGAMDNYSGSRSQSNVRLTNCLFQGNSAADAGGAISNAASGGSSYPVLINCSFQGNSINTSAGSRLGGAIYFSTLGDITGATLTNCSFQANTASQGGAIYVNSYQANSTTNVDLISCVVFGNGGDGTFVAGNVSQNSYGLIYLSNTLIEASATKYQNRGGNITTSTSPFASPNSPALAANSPAVNAGTSGVQGTDVVGNPRIVGCRIDLGAYELQYDPAVAITAQPAASSVVCGRASVSVPVGVSGQYLTYQWYKDSFANPVTGQTSATLTLTNVQPANAGSYSLVVTGSCNSLTSTAFNLTVNQPTVSISPVSATICQGKSVLLTASGASSGETLSYTWSNNTTGNTLSATTAGTYSVTGVDGNGCTNSATAVVTENKPSVSISPGSTTICPGKSVLLTASGASSYTWSNNTTDNTLSATTAGTYSVTGVNGNGCTNTATATITENKPTVSISPNPASICQASSVLLTASGASTGGTLSYTWSNNTTGNTLTATTAGTYSVTGVAVNGCFNSATATVTDTRPSVSITATPSATVTQGASITLTASGTGATSFAWSSGSTGNSTVINPATSAPYSVTARNGAGCVTVASLAITVTPIGCVPVVYVTQTGSGQRDGSSWNNALGSSQLQFGINAAANCGNNGQVWVAAGTYKPTTGTDRNASFALRNGVTIYGGFVGNETALTDRPALNPVADRPASTTLSGDIGTVGNISDNSFRVISNLTSLSLTATAVLDGFVITGGAGGTLGGGMFNDGSSPTLRNCSFVGNSVSASGSTISRGGAIYNGNSSSPQLYNCYFLNNSAFSSAGVNGFGGAMANLNSSNPQLTNCTFVNNRVSGSAQNQGGAIANNLNSSPQLINCSFLSNSASGSNVNRGGAMANASGCNAQLINCSFLNNSVSGATSSTSNQGGAVYNTLCTPQLTNCVLFGNGGANTIYNATGGSVVVAYSLLETTVTSFTAGTGNLTTDVSPFVSATDTRLNGCSPAINVGDNSVNSTTTDPDGNPRVYQNGRIDMGAYEYQGAAGVVTTGPTVNTATVGVAFSQNFTASGGSGPYSYSLASGSLPSGLSLSNTGVLSGTPTQTGSFTLSVKATNAVGCAGVSAPYVLTVTDAASPNPTLAGFSTSPGTVCVGSVATFTATVGNVTGSYGYTLTNGLTAPLTGTATTSTFSQSITASGTGTQSFTLTVSANGQSTASVAALTVSPSPVASLINNGPLTCAQSSVTLTASGGSSYTFANGSGVLGTPGPINTVVVSTAGTYSVSVASASGCLSTTTTVVTTDQTVPSISISSSSTTLTCASPTVSLSAIGSGSVRWSTGETTPVISVSVAGSYSVTATGGNGCSSVASVSVSQDNTVPVASLVSSGSLTCSVTSVTLTASPGGQSYSFSSGASQIGTSNQAVVSASGTYSVTVLSGNSCSASASTSVSQDNTAPVASLVSSGTLSCSVTSVTLTASPGGLNYLFSAGATQISTSNQAVVSMAGTYSVTVLSGNGCSAVASTTVQSTTAAVSITNPGVSTATVGVAFSQNFTAAGGTSPYNYSLASGSLPTGLGLSNTGVLSGTSTQSGSFTITVRGQDATGCSGVSAAYVLTVIDAASPNPTLAGFSTSPGAVCVGSVATFTATVGNVTGSYGYTLTNGLTAPLTGSASGSMFRQSITASGTGPQTFTLTVRANGQSVSIVTSLTVNSLPVASLTNNGPLSCTMTSVTLTASGAAGVPGNSYTFTSGSGVVGTPGSTNTLTVSTPGTYSVTVADASGCVSTTSTSVNADQNVPTISINPSSATLTCTSPSVSLTAVGTGNVLWSTGSTYRVITINTAGTYSVTITNGNGCSAVATTTVTSDQSAPPVTITANPSLTITQGQSATLTASGASTYAWSTNENAPAIVVNTAGPYSVTGTASNGCLATASVTLTVSPPGCGAGLSGPIWTGCLSTDWNTAGNWASGTVPTATDDVVIPSAPANQPVLSTAATAKSVEVQSRASLSIMAAGSLTINSAKSLDGNTMAFSNRGTVQNAGQLVLGNTAAIGQIGFWNRGVATNAGGQISIDRSTSSALLNSSGTFTNTGAITIGSTADAGSRGLRVDGGTVTNNPGGEITINRTGGLLNDATFVNASRLTIGNIALSAQDCIYSRGTFTNTTTGEIRADRASSNGIWHQNGTFRNDGKILIGTVANTGAAGILIDGTSFVNSAGAEIQIDRVRRGLTNRRNFTNAGQIRMGNRVALGERGVLNGNDEGTVAAVFTNQAGGLIQIDQTASGQDGLTNNVLATFTNVGTVAIGTLGNIGGNGIGNAGTFSNSACATLTVAAPINNGSSFLNAGLFTVSTTRTHSNTGTLTNNGLISYPQGNPIPNVVNNDVIAGPISSCSNIFNPALQLSGNSSQFSVGTTWYINAALTQSAGTYDQVGNTFTATNLAPGSSATLYVAATDKANGCTQTVPVNVTLNATVTARISPTNPTLTCASPTVSLTASGGSSYVWDDQSTNAIRTVSTSGTYSVTVNNGDGCSSVASVSVGQDNITPVATLSASPSTTLTCAQTSLTLTAGGGNSYAFGGPGVVNQSGNQATVNVAGVYSVTASNSTTGCFSTTTISISQDAGAPSVSINPSSATLTCANPTVSLTAVGSGSVRWSTGSTDRVITVTTAGTYSVTLTSANGCSASASAIISGDQNAPTASLVSSGSLTCAITSVTLTASPNGLSYVFSGPGGVISSTGNTAVVNTEGTYSVTVTNGTTGCASTTSIAVSRDASTPVATISASPSTTLSCAQTSLTLTAGSGNSYVFNGPGVVSQSGNQAVVNASGTYSVTVTNTATGCFSVTSITISQDNTAPSASLASSGPLSCAVTSVTLTANPNGQRYRFSAGASQIGSGNQATVSTPGLYSVTVINGGNGCMGVASVSVSQNNTAPQVTILANPSLTLTQGQSATLTAQGASTYTWSTGANTDAIVVSTAGTYSLTGTATNGCTGTPSTTLTVNSVVSGPFTITAVTTVNCDPVLPNRFSISFSPRYQGLDGTAVSFWVANELLPTTQPGPYTLQLYSDNPRITLNAVQNGVSSRFVYDWLAACNSATTPNTPPRVVMGIPGQTATQGSYVSYVIPDGTFTDTETPGSLKLSAAGLPAGLSFSGATLSGTPSTTVGSPFSITITATDPGGLSTSTTLSLTVQPATGTPPPTAPFAITGVTTISCTPVADRININFAPRYAGMSGQPIAFGVVNELAPTTDPAPYSLTLYLDNPVIILRATQTGSAGPVTFSYNWLTACASVGQANTPPLLNEPVQPQSATVGVPYSLNLSNTFIDQETPNQISLTASALPAGLTLSGKFISGTPSMSGMTSVTLTATDGGGLSTSTIFHITVVPGTTQPPTPPTTGTFSITGVTTVSCEVVGADERRLTFTPRYGGDNGGSITFSVVNELASTTASGPYTLRLYTDNPTITLSAVQSGISSQFRYNWLAACNARSRQSAAAEVPLSVRVLGNPVAGDQLVVEIRGAEGQPLQLSVSDERGRLVNHQVVEQAGEVERQVLALNHQPAGILVLVVSTPGQSQRVKVLKVN